MTLGDTFDLLAFGRFPAGMLHVTYDDTPRATTPAIEQAIAIEWERRTAEAQHSGRLLFNGHMFRYLRHDCSDLLHLTVGPTCYRDFVGTNLFNHHRVGEFGWERFSNPVGTTATLVTADGRIVYGRRSDRVAYHPLHVHTFGGALEAADRQTDGRIDAFDSVLRELHEELGLRVDEVLDLAAVAIVRDTEIMQPELLFEARVPLTLEQLIARWQTAESRDEHSELVWMAHAPQAVLEFIRTCGPIAPVAIAGLLLWGRARWGQAWYEQARGAQRA